MTLSKGIRPANNEWSAKGLCFRCHEQPRTTRPNGDPLSYCRKCINAVMRSRRVTPAGNLSTRRTELKRNYGMTPEQFDVMLDSQGGVCAICRGGPNTHGVFHVDHDHNTGAVRGILCGRCNAGIGYFLDSVEFLREAIKYLEQF